MSISHLDHFNIRTTELDAMRAFFVDVIGLKDGYRPSFQFPGHWLYGEDGGAIVHLVGTVDEKPGGADTGVIDHLAFLGQDRAAFDQRLGASGCDHKVRVLPDGSAEQVFVTGPEGITVEVVFRRET